MSLKFFFFLNLLFYAILNLVLFIILFCLHVSYTGNVKNNLRIVIYKNCLAKYIWSHTLVIDKFCQHQQNNVCLNNVCHFVMKKCLLNNTLRSQLFLFILASKLENQFEVKMCTLYSLARERLMTT